MSSSYYFVNMARFREDTMLQVTIDNDWYNHNDSENGMINKIMRWDSIIDTDDFMEGRYGRNWRLLSDDGKEELRRRNKWHLRTIILRANDIVASDFEIFNNQFYRPNNNV